MNRLTKIAMTSAAVLTAGLIAAAPLTAGKPDGAELWDKVGKCKLCHGEDGKGQTAMGKKKHAPDMTSKKWQDSVEDKHILEVILKGFEKEKDGKKFKHKSLKDGTDAQAQALLAHIRAFGGDDKAAGKGKKKGADKGEKKGADKGKK